MINFSNKVVLITGASRGIGMALASAFKERKAKLVLTAQSRTDCLTKFKDALVMPLDLSDKEMIGSLVNKAVEKFGRIDVLVNNAAIFKQTDFELISEDELERMLSIDFKGPFLLTQRVFSLMKEQGSGKIINIASGAGKMGSSKAMHYAAAKAALLSFTKSLARLAGKYNIHVNAIAPGFIETDMIEEMLCGNRKSVESQIPLGRVGSAFDIVGPVLFLASHESNYITGQVICVDGGHCIL